MRRTEFLYFPVDQVTSDEVLTWIESKSKTQVPHVIVVQNANKLWLAAHHPQLANIISSASLVIPEYSVVWGAVRLGLPKLNPIYGVALAQAFLPFASEKGLRPFFLGAKPDVIEALENKLRTQYPALQIAGTHHGYLTDPKIENEAIKLIQSSEADILFVAMGSPKQEYWIEEHKTQLNIPVLVGVGGSFDVLAGIKADTPDWIRGTGFEWLFRLIQQPKQYWRRYLVTNPWFLWQIGKSKFLSNRRSSDGRLSQYTKTRM